MANEQKPGTFVLFQNKKKSDNHPDYRGTLITPSGEPLEIAGWKKKSAKGEVYLSGTIQEPRPEQKPKEQPSKAANNAESNDDLPF